MTRGRAPTLLLVGSIALTLSGCASYSDYAPTSGSSFAPAAVGSYASAPDSNYASDSVASACSPYDGDPGCDYGDPYYFCDYGGVWWPQDGRRHDDARHGDYYANGHVMTYGFGHGGVGHGGFSHGGFGGGGGGHGR